MTRMIWLPVLAVATVALAEEPAPDTTVAAAPAVEAAAPEPKAPAAHPLPWLLAGTAEDYKPMVRFNFLAGSHVEVPLTVEGRVQDTSAYALDRYGTTSSSAPTVSPVARLGLKLTGPDDRLFSVLVEYEQDLIQGTAAGTLPASMGMPGSEDLGTEVRKAYLRLGYRNTVWAGGGVMTSHFGLGLVANDGAHGWEPGSAYFSDPRGGDRVLRGFVATGPYTPVGLMLSLAADKVLKDDSLLISSDFGTLSTSASDSANQVVGSATIGRPGQTFAGVYVAHRHQTSADGRWLAANVLDASASMRRSLGPSASLFVGAEAAYIFGNLTLTGTPTNPTQSVSQGAVAVRGRLDLGRYGVALDGLFASGDQNVDDGSQNGFRVSSNYDMGLVLFRQVLAAQSARGAYTAGDLSLVGAPQAGVERLPTRGAITDAVALFPRVFVRPIQGLEVYGGVLMAWAPVGLVDPFNSAVVGGSVRNATNGVPGKYYGTEGDVGVRARLMLWGTELMAGLEGGMLFPGSALTDASGAVPAPIRSGRVILAYRL